MFSKLDYFAFTFPIGLLGVNDNEYTLSHVLLAFHNHSAHRLLGVVTNALWRWESPVGRYENRIVCPKTGTQIQWSSGNTFALCTLSGQACDVVLKSISPADLALAANGRATRIDFAIDIEGDEQPKAFVDAGYSPAFKSSGFYETETGATYYVGSRTADRMCRIYRYASPHPRSHLLRIEAEYKGHAAKQACALLTKVELNTVCLAAHLPFAWQSSSWQPGQAEVSKIPARAYDRKGAGTMKWLRETVAPALKKAHREGLIDLDEWINEHLK